MNRYRYLYSIKSRCLKDGYLERQSRVVAGKVRNYSTATEKGKAALDEAREKIRELVTEVIEEK